MKGEAQLHFMGLYRVPTLLYVLGAKKLSIQYAIFPLIIIIIIFLKGGLGRGRGGGGDKGSE
jgi:hypothetical protein